jgi:hypothetical protein
MELRFVPPANDGGSQIVRYELYMNDGNPVNEPTNLVGSYTSNTMTHILFDTVDAMTAGKVYKFMYRAINALGNSEDSPIS